MNTDKSKASNKKKVLEVFAVIHYGNYEDNGMIINDSCPCCGWEPAVEQEASGAAKPEWHLGEMWNPATERGMGAYLQVLHCQQCGIVYATHLN